MELQIIFSLISPVARPTLAIQRLDWTLRTKFLLINSQNTRSSAKFVCSFSKLMRVQDLADIECRVQVKKG